MATTNDAKASRGRVALIPLLAALPFAAGVGAIAATFNQGPFLLTMLVFGLAVLPAAYGIGTLVLIGPIEPEYHEETVEHRWMVRASSGAFLDVVIGVGVTLAVISVFAIDLEARTTLVFVLGAAMVDVAVRYAMLRRQG